MLGDALVFPTNRSGWQKTVGAGGLLLAVVYLGSVGVYRFVSWGRSIAVDSVTIAVVLAGGGLVLSVVALAGYHVRVLRSGIADSVLPSFRPVGGLFSTGVGLCVIVFVYVVVPAVVLGWLVGALVSGTLGFPVEEASRASATAFSPAGQAGVLTAALVAVVLAYVSMAATARFAHDGRVRSAFAVRPVVGSAFTSEFFVGCVLWSGIVLVLGVVGTALVSVVVGLFLVFHATVAGTYAVGRGYGKCDDATARPSAGR